MTKTRSRKRQRGGQRGKGSKLATVHYLLPCFLPYRWRNYVVSAKLFAVGLVAALPRGTACLDAFLSIPWWCTIIRMALFVAFSHCQISWMGLYLVVRYHMEYFSMGNRVLVAVCGASKNVEHFQRKYICNCLPFQHRGRNDVNREVGVMSLQHSVYNQWFFLQDPVPQDLLLGGM